MNVEFLARKRPPFPMRTLRRRVEALRAAAGQEKAALTVLLSGDEELRRLNREWRGKDAATDVLSFELAHAHVLGTSVLGELAISLETARRQAQEHGHDLLTEVTILCAHGILHLCGYDHERGYGQAARMLREERRLLAAVGVARDALIARGSSASAEPMPPSAKPPSAKQPSAKKPSAKKPSAKQPSAKKPSAKKPSAKQPSAKQPSAKQPSAKKPSAKKPSAKQPSAKKPSAKKPSAAR